MKNLILGVSIIALMSLANPSMAKEMTLDISNVYAAMPIQLIADNDDGQSADTDQNQDVNSNQDQDNDGDNTQQNGSDNNTDSDD